MVAVCRLVTLVIPAKVGVVSCGLRNCVLDGVSSSPVGRATFDTCLHMTSGQHVEMWPYATITDITKDVTTKFFSKPVIVV